MEKCVKNNIKIGVVGGLGVVGSALTFGFRKLGHTVTIYDTKDKNNFIENMLYQQIIYICLPTPNKDNKCDISIIEEFLDKLNCLYKDQCKTFNTNLDKPYIVVKSTVTPGSTEQWRQKYLFEIAHSCEFLRERQATGDFVENQKLLVVGTNNKKLYKLVKKCHGHYPHNIVRLTPTESELLKYMHNSINALRVSFAGEFYDLAEKLGCDYTKVKNALLHSTSLPDIYLDVNANMRGWSSICWNKDVPAICQLGKKLGLDLPLLYNIEASNNRHEKTAFAKTREHY